MIEDFTCEPGGGIKENCGEVQKKILKTSNAKQTLKRQRYGD